MIPLVALLAATRCHRPAEPPSASPAAPRSLALPDPVPVETDCAGCHPGVSKSFARHGMASSLGPVDASRAPAMAPGRWIENPRAATAYRIEPRGGRLHVVERGRGIEGIALPARARPLIRAIGAGILDQSFVALDRGRHVFAPLEHFREHGWALAPAELQPTPLRLANQITTACYACHTTEPLPDPYPESLLEDFHPRAIGCDACHVHPEEHRRLLERIPPGTHPRGGLGVADLAALPRERRMDLCTRCHAQGDARIDLAPPGTPRPQPGDDLLARRIVFVTAHPTDDFGFASQSERLVLSPCFRAGSAAGLDCMTCHDPHVSTRDTPVETYEEACLGCHGRGEGEACSRPAGLAIGDVTPDRRLAGRRGCVACHMRRSAPFDLTHVRVTDHWIRRRIPPPGDVAAPQAKESPGGDWAVLRHGPPAAPADPATSLLESGARAMALVHLGHMRDAAAFFDRFAAAGTDEALVPTAPAGRPALERNPRFHFARGLALEATGRTREAARAFEDSLRLAPAAPHVSIHLALARLRLGDAQGSRALLDEVVAAHPSADHAWEAMVQVADATRDGELLLSALARRIDAWPHDAMAAYRFASLTAGAPDPSLAHEALRVAAQLDPDLPGLWFAFGIAAARRGVRSEARAALEEARRRDPADAATREALARLAGENRSP